MKRYTIVGGGVAGASIAYHLLSLGNSVTVYDRNDPGKASLASAGIIAPWISQRRNKTWYYLVKHGAAYYPEFIKKLEDQTCLQTGYQQRGVMSLFRNAEVLKKGYKRISAKQVDAPMMGDVQMIPKENTSSLHPTLISHFGSVFVPGGAQVKGALLNAALKQAVINLGGTWLHEDFSLAKRDGFTIYTTGAWGIEQQTKPVVRHQRSELFHFEIDSHPIAANNPVVMALGPIYIVDMGPNQFGIGTTHEDTESFDTTPNDKHYKYLKSLAETYFNGYVIRDIDMYVGLKPYTRDHLPFIGRVNEDTYVVNGLGSTGLTASPLIGREVARELTSTPSDIDLSGFNYILPKT